MKKILAMSVAATFALGASSVVNGAELAATTGTSFEDLALGAFDWSLSDAGVDTGTMYWYTDTAEAVGTITNTYYDGAAGYPEIAPLDPSLNQKCLNLDTDARLYRSIVHNNHDGSFTSVDIGSGLFFDSLVQFTATDTQPTPGTGDKLVVWLYGSDDLNADYGVATNLVVTAGYVSGDSTTATNYVIEGVSVEPNSWHRLTIKAIANITEYGDVAAEAKVGGFVVYIDGTPVANAAVKGDFTNLGGLTSAATALGNTLFPSIVSAGSAASTLSSVAFEGNGAVDDITFTTTDPFAVATFDYTVTVEDGDIGVVATYAVDGGSALSLTSGATLAIPVAATTVDFVVTVPDGYNLVGGVKDSASYDSVNDTYDWTLSVAVADLLKDGTDALTLSVVEDAETTTYVLTLTQGTGTTLTATVGGEPVGTGANVEENASVTITAALSDPTAYENLVVTVDGVAVILDNGQYTFTMEAATTVATSATPIEPSGEDWPTGDDLDSLAGTAVGVNYPNVPAALANADGKTFVTWAAGDGGVTYGTESAVNPDCFLLNIANDSTAEQIEAAKAAAAEAIKITAISVDGGAVTVTAPQSYGNGKVVIQGSAALAPASWHPKTTGDYFFRAALVVDEVASQD